MSHRTLPEQWTACRIGDPFGEFPVWSDGGARRYSGRRHEAGAGVICASRYYSTAMLEKLVHYRGQLPPNQHFVEIMIPTGTSYEVFNPDLVDGWSNRSEDAARRFAVPWYEEKRSASLIVPSVVARIDQNIVFNTVHPHFADITVGLEAPVWWGERLFS